ncbi:MAG: peptidase domain-containing ABC transporter [Negativicutes bacterium]|nr:peptidase domain-containing ABC transporter [Negativicutes bacterium]
MAQQRLDSALHSLVTVVRMLGLPADPEQLKRAYVVRDEGMDTLTLLRAARDLGLKAKAFFPNAERISRLPFPAIARLKNNDYVVVVKMLGEDRAVIVDPHRQQAFSVPLEKFLELWGGEMIFLTRRSLLRLRNVTQKFGLSWFAPILWRYKKLVLHVMGLSLVLQLLGMASPLFTQTIIDKVLVHHSLTTLDILVLGVAVVTVFQVTMMVLRSYLFNHTTNRMDVTLSSRLFKHITSLPLRFFEQWQAGDIVSRVREVDTVRGFITGTAMTAVLDSVFAVVYIGVMIYYSPLLSVVALAAVPLLFILIISITPLFRRRMNESFAARAESQSFLIESLNGVQTLKSLAVEPIFTQKWEQILAKNVKTTFAATHLGNLAGNTAGFVQQTSTLAILWVGTKLVMAGSISVGELIAFQMYSSQVIGPLVRLLNIWQSFQQSRVSLDRLGDIMDEVGEPSFNPNRTTLPSIAGEIILDRVTFRYRVDGAEVLKQVSLQVDPGQRIALVGKSGSGKSTLTKLLQRLYVPESGRVLIDGVDLSQVEPAWLRRQIGVVLQENVLFSGTVRENIAMAKTGATDEEVQRAAELSGAHEFISRMPDGYDTYLAERGKSLSGGQRQRLAIARALITDPRILIFDEATSALDYESEKVIMDNLDKIAAGRTMVIIAHRLSTVRGCDRIYMMEKGRIVEQGSHDALLEQDGMYAAMVRQQYDL